MIRFFFFRAHTEYDQLRGEHISSVDKFKQLKEVISLHVNNLKLMSSLSLPELKLHLIAPDEEKGDDDSFALSEYRW